MTEDQQDQATEGTTEPQVGKLPGDPHEALEEATAPQGEDAGEDTQEVATVSETVTVSETATVADGDDSA